jgi:hypothetical protein
VSRSVDGVEVPLIGAGLSWDLSRVPRTIAEEVVAVLEDRRVLYNPYHWEVAEFAARSVDDIRKTLTDAIGRLDRTDPLCIELQQMRAACRRFLDEVQGIDVRHLDLNPRWFDSDALTFLLALGDLRGRIGEHLTVIVDKYKLALSPELELILSVQA